MLWYGTLTAAHSPTASVMAMCEAPKSRRNQIGIEACHYLYLLILMDITRRVSTDIEPGKKPGFGPAGMFHHLRAYPSVKFREAVRPNFDTLYSPAWFDVSKEP